MTLIDTCVWAGHFRHPDVRLMQLLAGESAGVHPFVIGELACGNLKNRAVTLANLAKLPRAPVAGEAEVHHLLESRRLWGTGLGWIDLHLLASAALAGWGLMTADRALLKAAETLGLAHPAL